MVHSLLLSVKKKKKHKLSSAIAYFVVESPSSAKNAEAKIPYTTKCSRSIIVRACIGVRKLPGGACISDRCSPGALCIYSTCIPGHLP